MVQAQEKSKQRSVKIMFQGQKKTKQRSVKFMFQGQEKIKQRSVKFMFQVQEKTKQQSVNFMFQSQETIRQRSGKVLIQVQEKIKQRSIKFMFQGQKKVKQRSVKLVFQVQEKIKQRSVKFIFQAQEKSKQRSVKFMFQRQEKSKQRSVKFMFQVQEKIKQRSVKFMFQVQEKIKQRSVKFMVQAQEKIKLRNTRAGCYYPTPRPQNFSRTRNQITKNGERNIGNLFDAVNWQKAIRNLGKTRKFHKSRAVIGCSREHQKWMKTIEKSMKTIRKPVRKLMISGTPVQVLRQDQQFHRMRFENLWLTSTVWDLVESSVRSSSPGSVARRLWQWLLLPTEAADQIQELTFLQSQSRQLLATIEALTKNKIQTDKKIDNWRYCLTHSDGLISARKSLVESVCQAGKGLRLFDEQSIPLVNALASRQRDVRKFQLKIRDLEGMLLQENGGFDKRYFEKGLLALDIGTLTTVEGKPVHPFPNPEGIDKKSLSASASWISSLPLAVAQKIFHMEAKGCRSKRRTW